MDPGTVTILTATLYKSVEELRFYLACQMIGNAVALGYNVSVVDNSPDPLVRESFSRISAEARQQLSRSGMGPQRRELFRAIPRRFTETKFFLWTEPEKPDLIRSIPQIIAPLESGEADIVIPCRSEESLKTYPEFQVVSERKMNRIYREITGLPDADPTIGPVAFGRRVLYYFVECSPQEQYGEGAHDGYIQLYAPLKAMARGHRIATVEIDCFYPAAQKKEEDGKLATAMLEKRKMQADTITSTWRRMAEVLGLPQLQH